MRPALADAHPLDFAFERVLQRLEAHGDPWQDILTRKQSPEAALRLAG